MTRLVWRKTLEPTISFFSLCLQEWDDAALPLPYPEGIGEEDGFVTAREGRVDITSAGHSHVATMVMEVWDAEPAPSSEVWDEKSQVELNSVSGSVLVWSMAGLAVSDRLVLGERGNQWAVRVHCAGRAEVAHRAAVEGMVEGVERYLIQIWPAG